MMFCKCLAYNQNIIGFCISYSYIQGQVHSSRIMFIADKRTVENYLAMPKIKHVLQYI